jgi:hypothetical protein
MGAIGGGHLSFGGACRAWRVHWPGRPHLLWTERFCRCDPARPTTSVRVSADLLAEHSEPIGTRSTWRSIPRVCPLAHRRLGDSSRPDRLGRSGPMLRQASGLGGRRPQRTRAPRRSSPRSERAIARRSRLSSWPRKAVAVLCRPAHHRRPQDRHHRSDTHWCGRRPIQGARGQGLRRPASLLPRVRTAIWGLPPISAVVRWRAWTAKSAEARLVTMKLGAGVPPHWRIRLDDPQRTVETIAPQVRRDSACGTAPNSPTIRADLIEP